mgnify:FL=1
MSAVLHTWGSDLKYHVHLHCLVTFGGYNEQDGKWHWPKRKRKIARYRKLSGKYRAIFLKKLKKLMELGQVDYHQSYEELESSLPKKRWVVNHQWPTAETKVIEEYLGRYICRIGISNKRLSYDNKGQNVCIAYNNYREQKAGQPAPKAYRHMEPLVAIHQILQHQLPKYFQRSRHYGLHAAPTYERLKGRLPSIVKQEGATVRTIIQILRALLQEEPYCCEACSGTDFQEEHLAPDPAYAHYYVLGSAPRSPPVTPQRAPAGTPAFP